MDTSKSPRPKRTPYRVTEGAPKQKLKFFTKSRDQELLDAKDKMRAGHTSQKAPSTRVPTHQQKRMGDPVSTIAQKIAGGTNKEKTDMAVRARDTAAKKLGEMKGFPSTSRQRGRGK